MRGVCLGVQVQGANAVLCCTVQNLPRHRPSVVLPAPVPGYSDGCTFLPLTTFGAVCTPRRLTKKQLSAWVHVAPPGQYEEIWFRGGHT